MLDFLKSSFKLVTSFEFFFVFFLMIGEIKSIEELKPINQIFDLTLLTMLINGALGVVVLFKKREHKFSRIGLYLFFAFILFVTFSFISFFFFSKGEVAEIKMLETSTIILWVVFSSIFIIDSPERIKRVIYSFLISGIIINYGLISSLLSGSFLEYGGVGGFGGGYQRAGTISGFNILICVIGLLHTKKPKLVLLGIASIALISLIFSAHRSTWLAMISALFLTYIFSTSGEKIRNKITLLFLILSIPVGISFLLTIVPRGEYLIERFTEKSGSFIAKDEGKGNPRLFKYKYTSNLIIKEPKVFLLGIGYGNFKNYSGLRYRHTHNLFLEILGELGIFIFIPFLVFLFGWRKIKTPKNHSHKLLLFVTELFFWYYLSHSMFGGDIPDNRILWAFVLMLYNLKIYLYIENKKNRFKSNLIQ